MAISGAYFEVMLAGPGAVLAGGVFEAGAVAGQPVLEEARALGASL